MIHQTSENKDYVYVEPPVLYTDEWAVRIAERHYAPVLLKDTLPVTDFVARNIDMRSVAWNARYSMGKTTLYQSYFEAKLREHALLIQPYETTTTLASN